MCVVSAAVFEHPADQGYDGQTHTDVQDPEADGEAEEPGCGRQAKDERPPAPGAEVSLLAGTLMNLGVESVLGAVADSLTGEAEVKADHRGHTTCEVEREEPDGFGPFDEEPVNSADQKEEGCQVDEEIRFELHASASFSVCHASDAAGALSLGEMRRGADQDTHDLVQVVHFPHLKLQAFGHRARVSGVCRHVVQHNSVKGRVSAGSADDDDISRGVVQDGVNC